MKQRAYGFTIVELLIVIVVIAILSAITVVAYNGIQNNAKDSAIRADIQQNITKVNNYAITSGGWPTTHTTFTTSGIPEFAFKITNQSYYKSLPAANSNNSLMLCTYGVSWGSPVIGLALVGISAATGKVFAANTGTSVVSDVSNLSPASAGNSTSICGSYVSTLGDTAFAQWYMLPYITSAN